MTNIADIQVEVRAAFHSDTVIVKLRALKIKTELSESALISKKFLQVLASVSTVGLVEPIAVIEDIEHPGNYHVLDGRMRLEALKRLGKEEALCLIATDDETYTYNKHISRLTAAQDSRMIAKAILQGVSRERIANVLGVDKTTVNRKAALLEGLCREAMGLLADKNCPSATFIALKAMAPLRQIEAAELMCGQQNFSSSFAKAILAATPPEQLSERPAQRRKVTGEVGVQLAKLERELATLQAQAQPNSENYGIDHLHLTVASSYVSSLMRNPAVFRWLTEQYPEYAAEMPDVLSELAETKGQRRVSKAHEETVRSDNEISGS